MAQTALEVYTVQRDDQGRKHRRRVATCEKCGSTTNLKKGTQRYKEKFRDAIAIGLKDGKGFVTCHCGEDIWMGEDIS